MYNCTAPLLAIGCTGARRSKSIAFCFRLIIAVYEPCEFISNYQLMSSIRAIFLPKLVVLSRIERAADMVGWRSVRNERYVYLRFLSRGRSCLVRSSWIIREVVFRQCCTQRNNIDPIAPSREKILQVVRSKERERQVAWRCPAVFPRTQPSKIHHSRSKIRTRRRQQDKHHRDQSSIPYRLLNPSFLRS